MRHILCTEKTSISFPPASHDAGFQRHTWATSWSRMGFGCQLHSKATVCLALCGFLATFSNQSFENVCKKSNQLVSGQIPVLGSLTDIPPLVFFVTFLPWSSHPSWQKWQALWCLQTRDQIPQSYGLICFVLFRDMMSSKNIKKKHQKTCLMNIKGVHHWINTL